MSKLPEELERFIQDRVGTVWAAELLLLLYRGRGHSRSIADLDRELRANPGLVQSVVTRFRNAGLVAQDRDGVRYAPTDQETDDRVSRFALLFAGQPRLVMRVIAAARRQATD